MFFIFLNIKLTGKRKKIYIKLVTSLSAFYFLISIPINLLTQPNGSKLNISIKSSMKKKKQLLIHILSK